MSEQAPVSRFWRCLVPALMPPAVKPECQAAQHQREEQEQETHKPHSIPESAFLLAPAPPDLPPLSDGVEQQEQGQVHRHDC